MSHYSDGVIILTLIIMTLPDILPPARIIVSLLTVVYGRQGYINSRFYLLFLMQESYSDYFIILSVNIRSAFMMS